MAIYIDDVKTILTVNRQIGRVSRCQAHYIDGVVSGTPVDGERPRRIVEGHALSGRGVNGGLA